MLLRQNISCNKMSQVLFQRSSNNVTSIRRNGGTLQKIFSNSSVFNMDGSYKKKNKRREKLKSYAR
jgi:hypothetical protein